jgi:indolepyruvate ferredoxin oxidoreductase alpha subunit
VPPEILNGEQALARGALEAGVRVVTGYPGSPSSGTLEALLGEPG